MKVRMCNRCRLLELPFHLYAWVGGPGGGHCWRGVLMGHSSAAELQMRTQVRLLPPSALPVSLAAPLSLTDALKSTQITHDALAPPHTKSRSAFAASPVEHYEATGLLIGHVGQGGSIPGAKTGSEKYFDLYMCREIPKPSQSNMLGTIAPI